MSIEISKLSNGLTVATDRMDHVETAAIGAWASVGARFETPEVLGVSHFLEHMAFKGTKTRTALQIVEEIEMVGGYLNAYTSREQTAYYVRILQNDIPLAIDIIADILTHSTFAEEEMERERGVILQEIGQCADNPEDLIFDQLQEIAYPDQPMGRPILGTPESVGAISSQNLFDHMGTHYGAETIILAASGAVDHQQVCGLAESAFADLGSLAQSPKPAGSTFGGGMHKDVKDFEQAHVTLGFPGVSVLDPDFYTAQVFSEILGGSMSSRLFQEVREVRGLCYSIYSFKASYTDAGMFGIYAGTSGDSANELIKVSIGEIEKLAGHVSDAEVTRARAQAKAGILMSLESPHSRCEWIARHLPRYGRVLSPEELVTQIEAVDGDSVKSFALRIMETKKPAIAVLGDVSGVESYDRITARLAS